MTVHDNSTDALAAEMLAIGAAARDAARAMREADDDDQDQGAARSRRAPSAPRKAEILAANAARSGRRQGRQHGRADAWIGWRSNDARIEAMAKGVEDVAALPDPGGRELARWTRPNGLDIARVATPIGVIGIIYESRPNVTADAGALALKAGNVAILRGGSDSHPFRRRHSCGDGGRPEGGGPARSRHPSCAQHRPRRGGPDAGRLERRDRSDHSARRQGPDRAGDATKRGCRCWPIWKGFAMSMSMPRPIWKRRASVVLNAKMRRTSVCGAAETLLLDRAVLKSPRRCRSWKIWPRPAAKSAATRRCARSFPPPSPPPKKTGRPNISTPSSRCRWWTGWKRRSGISSIMARIIPTPSSPKTQRRRRLS